MNVENEKEQTTWKKKIKNIISAIGICMLMVCPILIYVILNMNVFKAEKMINNLGEITLDSIKDIQEVEEFFNGLSKSEKQRVGNKEILDRSREAYDNQKQAREEVLEKWSNGTAETMYLLDMHEKYANDEVIANIYYYATALEHYDFYKRFGFEDDLRTTKTYSAMIDKDYSGEYSEEMHKFVSDLSEALKEENNEIVTEKDRYSSLTNSGKRKICEFIQKRYDYYDSVNGGYSGDKYSDIIMNEAAETYGLTVGQIEIIWMNMYSY